MSLRLHETQKTHTIQIWHLILQILEIQNKKSGNYHVCSRKKFDSGVVKIKNIVRKSNLKQIIDMIFLNSC